MTITFKDKHESSYLDGAFTVIWNETVVGAIALLARLVVCAGIGWLFGYAKEAVAFVILLDAYHGLSLDIRYSESK